MLRREACLWPPPASPSPLGLTGDCKVQDDHPARCGLRRGRGQVRAGPGMCLTSPHGCLGGAAAAQAHAAGRLPTRGPPPPPPPCQRAAPLTWAPPGSAAQRCRTCRCPARASPPCSPLQRGRAAALSPRARASRSSARHTAPLHLARTLGLAHRLSAPAVRVWPLRCWPRAHGQLAAPSPGPSPARRALTIDQLAIDVPAHVLVGLPVLQREGEWAQVGGTAARACQQCALRQAGSVAAAGT